MSDHPSPEFESHRIVEPAQDRAPLRPRRLRRLAAIGSVALGVATASIGLGPHLSPIVPESAAAGGALGAGYGDLRAMTLNQALGANLASVLATPAAGLNAALLELLQVTAASSFPLRAERQAQLIARHAPDLVGLQEVWDLECADLDAPPPGQGCAHPSIADAFVDHLAVTLEALAALGAGYQAVASVTNLDLATATPTFGIPFEIDGFRALLTSSDRDVILARTDTVVDPVPVSFADVGCRLSGDGCNYQFVLPVQLPTAEDGTLDLLLERGFVAVDATVRGVRYRFVNTHLEIREPVPREFQCVQAAELLAVLALTPEDHRLIVVGDMNSAPEDVPVPITLPLPLPPACDPVVVPPYLQFVEAGYADAWTLRPGAVPGFTCCQDADLANPLSKLSERIDLIFALEQPARVDQARVVGAHAADRTRPPGPRLWPSDHGGVVAQLEFFDVYAAGELD